MLSGEDIVALWQSGGEMRRVAATEIVRNFDEHSSLFFRYVSMADTVLRRSAKKQFPLLRDGMAQPEPFDATASYATFAYLHRWLKGFFEALDAYLEKHPEEGHVLVPSLAAQFTTLRRDLSSRYSQYPLPAEEPKRGGNRQLMIFVTGRCNFHCPYCFSSDIEQREVSEQDLRALFQWAHEQGVTSITPCGGEPLMYRHFQTFLELARTHGMKTYFATNFTIDIARFQGFTPDLVETLYIHLAGETLGKAHFRRAVVCNIASAKRLGIPLVARANITSPDCPDVPQWLHFMQEMGLRRLHVALTMPSERQTNTYVPVEHFREYIPVIQELLDTAPDYGVTVAIAKPVPLCLFPERTADALLMAEDSVAMCGLHRDDYMYNVCLSPSLQFTPCLGLNEPSVMFRPSLQWQDLSDLFRPRLEGLLQQQTYRRCASCFLWQRHICQGVCLSYKEKTCQEN